MMMMVARRLFSQGNWPVVLATLLRRDTAEVVSPRLADLHFEEKDLCAERSPAPSVCAGNAFYHYFQTTVKRIDHTCNARQPQA